MTAGWIPTPIREVKPFAAVVQPGDSVSRIAHRMTGDANRWPELVGANLHKELSSGNVSGSPYRVFRSLQVGETLFIPGSWGISGSGSVGKKATPGWTKTGSMFEPPGINPQGSGSLDWITPAIANIVTGLQGTPGTPQPPAPYTMPDIAKVITSWWPYLPPGVLPPGITVPTTTTDITSWQNLIKSALAFLQLGQVMPGQIDILSSIPWDKVPWDKIPWQPLAQALLDAVLKSKFWQMLINSTTIQLSKGTFNIQFSGSPAKNINFFDPSIWSNDKAFQGVNSFGWTNVPWSGIADTNWAKIDDAELLSCMTANPARAAELAKNAACFKGDPTKLKEYMCNPQLDASKCASTVDPRIPVVPPGIDWTCAPSPQCIADQLKNQGVPQVCPPPGGSYPECIPEWYKTITKQDLPAKEEDKKTANLPLYVGLGVAGLALVAGIVVIAAAD